MERCVNRLKQWRAVATHFEKRALNYRALVVIAALFIWLNPWSASPTTGSCATQG